MPLVRFIQPISGTCRHCGQPDGSPAFSETALRRTFQSIAANSYHDDTSILQAIEQGFAQSVTISQADSIITQQEKRRCGPSVTGSPSRKTPPTPAQSTPSTRP